MSRVAFGRRPQSCRSGEDGGHRLRVEKIVRDLRVHQILEGANEIMRVIVARGLIEN
jgi:alkylation response protein AidB-like acyl-CoA dehydrogenase